VNFFGLRRETSQTQNLIEQNQRRQQNRGGDRERWIGDGQSELTGANLVRVRAPQNHACCDPLKRESGSVE